MQPNFGLLSAQLRQETIFDGPRLNSHTDMTRAHGQTDGGRQRESGP